MDLLSKVDTAAGALTANAGSILLQLSFIDNLNTFLQTLTVTVNLLVGIASGLILYRTKIKQAKELKKKIEQKQAANEDLQDADSRKKGEETPST